MLTHRSILGVGALALALAVSACSEDRATGPADAGAGPATPAAAVPSAGPAGPQGPVSAPRSAEGETGPSRVRPGDGGTGTATVISSSVYDGHQLVLSEVPTGRGDESIKRVTLDGAVLMEFSGMEASGGETADAKVFLDGQLIMNESLDLQAFRSAGAPAGGGVVPGTPAPGGPLLMAALPCGTELALFGAASVAVSAALAWFRVAPSSFSWDALKLAVGAEVTAAVNLYACLKKFW